MHAVGNELHCNLAVNCVSSLLLHQCSLCSRPYQSQFLWITQYYTAQTYTNKNKQFLTLGPHASKLKTSTVCAAVVNTNPVWLLELQSLTNRVQPAMPTVNVTLPTFAAAAPLPLGVQPRRRRSVSPARWAPSSKPAARHCWGQSTAQTDRQMDGWTPDPYIDLARYIECAMWLALEFCYTSQLTLMNTR